MLFIKYASPHHLHCAHKHKPKNVARYFCMIKVYLLPIFSIYYKMYWYTKRKGKKKVYNTKAT